MAFKLITLTLFVACTQAIRYDHYSNGHEATSSIQFNDNHNTVHHIQSPSKTYAHAAPQPIQYSHAPAPVQYTHAAPQPVHYAPVAPAIKVAAPVIVKAAPAPSHGHASSYSSVSFGHDSQYASPKFAAPKIATVAKFVAPKVISAPVYQQSAPVYHQAAPVYHQASASAGYHHEEDFAPAKYEFAYGVEDHHTGDIHSHKESRDGDVTHGEYSLHEADGTIRTVKYTVDKHSGFNAVVERSGHAHAQAQPVKVAAPAPYYHH